MNFLLAVFVWLFIAAAIGAIVFVLSSSVIAAIVVAVVALWIEARVFFYYF